jgi:hypothetical protein
VFAVLDIVFMTNHTLCGQGLRFVLVSGASSLRSTKTEIQNTYPDFEIEDSFTEKANRCPPPVQP